MLGRFAVPYVRVLFPGLALLLGFVGVVELLSFLTIGAAQGKKLVLFGSQIDVYTAKPWVVAFGLFLGGAAWLRFESLAFGRLWDEVTGELKAREREGAR